MSDAVANAFAEAMAEVMAGRSEARVLTLECSGELTEMGIRITIHSPTARAVYEFAVDDDPDVLWAIIKMSKQIVVQQVDLMQKSMDEAAAEILDG